MVEDLELPYLAPMGANLADNSRIVTSVYQGIIYWNRVQRVVPVLAMSRRTLLGTALLEDVHLGIDFCEGGLPPLHRDPFDRILICQALQNNLTIATADTDELNTWMKSQLLSAATDQNR